MPTIRDAMDRLDERLFVGREREVTLFRHWLGKGTDEPALLDVSGPGGTGKSTLLRAFRRVAEAEGWRVVLADGSAFKPTPAQLSVAITGARGSDGADYLNEAPTVLILDTFEELGALTHHLQDQLLPRLRRTVKVVISGRQPLGTAWSAWGPVVQSIVLSGFPPDASRAYLRVRGVGADLEDEVTGAAGGSPLALSLAADMVTQLGVREFRAAPEWRLALRSLVEDLLRDVRNQDLRQLLEAAAVVRQFDEELLAAVVDKDDISAPFAALCGLSSIRPTEHGLMLHDDIRRILIEDLRWRRPQLLVELRQRAWRHYRRRMRESPDAAWMIADELHLSGNDLIQAMVSQGSDPRLAWVERAGPADHADIMRILDAFTSQASSLPDAPSPEEVDPQFVGSLLAHPAARVTMVRERDARLTGYAFVLPISRQTLDLLPSGGALRRLVEATCSATEIADLPDDFEDATLFIFSTIVHSADHTPEASAALVRDVLPALLAGGKYLACTASERYAAVLDAFGFARVASGLGPSAFDPDRRLEAFALDLRLVGAETWIDSIVTGRRLPRELAVEDVAREVQAVLLHWADDAELEVSPLVAMAARRDPESELSAADAVRALIREALERARAGANEDRELAFRALELAYLEHTVSHERVAERLSVSRSTFYRLLKRAIAGVAAALGRP
jgi:hypothetical protein